MASRYDRRGVRFFVVACALAVHTATGLGCLIELTPGFGEDGSATGSGSASGSDTGSATLGSSSDAVDSSGGGSEDDTTGGVPEPLPLPPRGYQARPCGFDLDRDGEVGEPEDCVVCDGVTADPDGDGYAQPILYVDCDAGLDAEPGAADACRDFASPCATISRAMEEIPHAQGNFDGQGTVCFSGTCREVVPIRSGAPAIGTRPASGNEVRDFDYPAEPSMLVGWDRDGDHEYPPYDRDEVSEIVPPATAEGALYLGYGSYSTPTHDIEYAHFVVSADALPGEVAPNTALFVGPIGVGEPHERLHLHDLSVRSLRRGRSGSAESPVVPLNLAGYGPTEPEVESTQFHHFALENVEILDYGGFLFAEHADMQADPTGPLRIANVTARAMSCDKADCDRGATASIWRMGGWVGEIEILSSVFEAGTDAWFPFEGGDPVDDPGPTAILVGECTHDIAILDNDFTGWATALRVEANGSATTLGVEDSRPCAGRDVDLVRFEGNVVSDASDRLAGSTVAIVLQTSHPDPDVGDDRTIAGARIVNNVVRAEHGLLGCAWAQVWGAGAGAIVLAHNTCLSGLSSVVPYPDAALVRVLAPRAGAIDPAGEIAALGNLFSQQNDGDVAILTEYAPAAWSADHNVFSPSAAFRWMSGASVDLSGWRAASGADAASAGCEPELFAAGDFHLDEADACAADLALAVPGIADDIDGDPRVADAPWDAGADERTP